MTAAATAVRWVATGVGLNRGVLSIATVNVNGIRAAWRRGT